MDGYLVTAAAVQVVVGRKVHLVSAGDPLPDGVDDAMAARLVDKGMVVEIGDHSEPEPVPEPNHTVDEQEQGEVKLDLSGMNLDQLRTYAADHNIDLGGATRKDDIIAAINAA